MTERAEKLRALAERVERGEWDPANIRRVWPYVRGQSARDDLGLKAADAFDGSLDACAALHEAVLGERWACEMTILPDNANANLSRIDGVSDGWSRAMGATPARAWLAAILRALAEEGR